MGKQASKPSLPAEVAKVYESTIVPTTVMISKGPAAGTYDLTKISMADAKKLADAEKYLRAIKQPGKAGTPDTK
jgi:hypothetical protein